MSQPFPPPPPGGSSPVIVARPRRRSPLPMIILILVLAGVVCALAYYQEQLAYFMNLKLWDRGAPARTVHDFLQASSQGNQSAALQYVDKAIQPLMKDGKFVGYFTNSNPILKSKIYYPFNKIVPTDLNEKMDTEFVFKGDGAANVTFLDHDGREETMHLVVQNGSWRIMGIS